jgi:hypothetical protein
VKSHFGSLRKDALMSSAVRLVRFLRSLGVSASIEILRQLPFGNVSAAWFATRRVSEDLS